MDPEATIREAETHAEEHNPDDAAQLVLAYQRWRERGGVHTLDLDQRARAVAAAISGMGGYPKLRLRF